MIEIRAYALPGAQGSKKYVGHSKKTGRAILVENSAKVKPWRESVVYAAVEQLEKRGNAGLVGAIVCEMTFTLVKPKSAKRGAVPAKAPDLDKLCRSTFDALTTAGVWEDDSRVVALRAAKRYPNEGEDALPRPGAVIRVWELHEFQNQNEEIAQLL